MYYILIVIGVLLVAAGIIGLTHRKTNGAGSAENETPNDNISENATVNSDLSWNGQNASTDSAVDDGLSDAERKGRAFELFVRDHFSNKNYSLVEHVNDNPTYEHVTERSKGPDMVFRHLASDEQFAVECKYRSGWDEYDGKVMVEWASEENIRNYLAFADERKMNVVVIIGVGGTPDSPNEVYAAPLKALKKYTTAYKKYLEQFRLANPNGKYKYIISRRTVVSE